MRATSEENDVTYCASWSGGKDSCLASYLAIKKGSTISHLVHFDRPNNLHGVDPVHDQGAGGACRYPHGPTTGCCQRDFEREFKQTVTNLKKEGVNGMVFGDIYLEPHKEWVDRTCAELGIVADEPLWGMNTEKIVQDFLALGFRDHRRERRSKTDRQGMDRQEDGHCIH